MAILRTPEGLDYTAMLTDPEDGDYILNALGNLHRSSSAGRTLIMLIYVSFSPDSDFFYNNVKQAQSAWIQRQDQRQPWEIKTSLYKSKWKIKEQENVPNWILRC